MKNGTLVLLLAASCTTALAAGFDCRKAAAPIETAICRNAAFSSADESMTESYRFLGSFCRSVPGVDALQAAQRGWLSELRSRFGAGELSLVELEKRYSDRNAELNALLAQCSRLRTEHRPVKVMKIGDKAQRYELPYVVAASPEISRRINDALFEHLLDRPAPAKLADGQAIVAELARANELQPLAAANFKVIRNDGRLLVFELAIEGCGAYCESSTGRLQFDTRSGRKLDPEELFTDAGAKALSRHLKSAQIRRGKALLAKATKNGKLADGEAETYQRCLNDWAGFEPRLWPLSVTATGKWRFVAGNCSAHVNRSEDLLDRLDAPVPPPQLAPHLNAYGRSLLLGDGDVREPNAALRCERHDRPPLPAGPAEAGAVLSVAGGSEHHLLVDKSGRLWAWGRNHNGEMGHVDNPSNGADFFPPAIVAEDFAQVPQPLLTRVAFPQNLSHRHQADRTHTGKKRKAIRRAELLAPRPCINRLNPFEDRRFQVGGAGSVGKE